MGDVWLCLIKICLEDKKKELQLGIPHLPQSLILGHPFNLFFWNKRKKKCHGVAWEETRAQGSGRQVWSEQQRLQSGESG